jgi:hypothetical protein
MLPTAVTIQNGEQLFVAVQFAGTFPNITCLVGRVNPPAVADRNYWSNAGAAPYQWVTGESVNIKGNIMIEAIQ